jgi:hypothetical protein
VEIQKKKLHNQLCMLKATEIFLESAEIEASFRSDVELLHACINFNMDKQNSLDVSVGKTST